MKKERNGKMDEKNLNKVMIIGKLAEPLSHSHVIGRERFLKGLISAHRPSGADDMIPIIISERVKLPEGTMKLLGKIRSYDDKIQSRLKVFLMVESAEEISEGILDTVELEGYICTKPYKKITCNGTITTEFILANNQGNGRSYYIPVVCWNSNGHYASNLTVGTKVKLFGRFQSRNYHKKGDNFDCVRTTYEVNVCSIASL